MTPLVKGTLIEAAIFGALLLFTMWLGRTAVLTLLAFYGVMLFVIVGGKIIGFLFDALVYTLGRRRD